MFVTGLGPNEIKQMRQAVKLLCIGDYIRVVYDTLPFGEEGINPYTIGKIVNINMGRDGGIFRKPDVPEVWIDSLIKIRETNKFNAVWYHNSGYYYPSPEDRVDKAQAIEFIKNEKRKREQEAYYRRIERARIDEINSITEDEIQLLRKDLDY